MAECIGAGVSPQWTCASLCVIPREGLSDLARAYYPSVWFGRASVTSYHSEFISSCQCTWRTWLMHASPDESFFLETELPRVVASASCFNQNWCWTSRFSGCTLLAALAHCALSHSDSIAPNYRQYRQRQGPFNDARLKKLLKSGNRPSIRGITLHNPSTLHLKQAISPVLLPCVTSVKQHCLLGPSCRLLLTPQP